MAADPELIVEGNHTLEGGEEAIFETAKSALAPDRGACSKRHDGDWCDAQVLIAKDPGSTRSFRDWLRQYPPLAIYNPPLDTIEMSQAENLALAFQALLHDVHARPEPERTEYVLKTSFVIARFNSDESGKRSYMSFPQGTRCGFHDYRGRALLFGLLGTALPGKAQAREPSVQTAWIPFCMGCVLPGIHAI